MKTAWMACRLGLVVYILPFMFVYNKALMLMGDLGEIIIAILTALMGVYCLACGSKTTCSGRPKSMSESPSLLRPSC